MNSREDFDKIANEIFFPIYEVIAQEALRILGRKNGVCLDVGCGGGHLPKCLYRKTSYSEINTYAFSNLLTHLNVFRGYKVNYRQNHMRNIFLAFGGEI